MITNLTFTNRLSKTTLISLGLAAASLAFAPGQAKAETRTFNIAPSGANPGLNVTLDDTTNPGSITVKVDIAPGSDGGKATTADISGIFLNLPEGVGTLKVSSVAGGPATTVLQESGKVSDLDDGVNMKGDGPAPSFDVGIKIGYSGGASNGGTPDDFQTTTFTLSGSGLSLDSFTNEGFGVRLKSVGLVGATSREGSLKLETTMTPIVVTNPGGGTTGGDTTGGDTTGGDTTGGDTTGGDTTGGSDSVPVPEPLTMGGLILGAGGLIAARRRKMSQKG
ncbi:PEP-CTERM sorting domain-containing protein [Laspinema palackyanum]|uniref:PEP-CTERM sorting domain-containing protein n=1 Tax=Laspinema palackyanum TaxID=3231601 RepID=UPI00345D64B6|nr:PEP-CTERM sorting domain-containing protein [Laspinema sp. D2c]